MEMTCPRIVGASRREVGSLESDGSEVFSISQSGLSAELVQGKSISSQGDGLVGPKL